MGDQFVPLTGVRVVDTGRWVAAPWCAQVLSWLGAEVIRIEPNAGDPLLELADGPASAARCLYDDANRGKVIHRAEAGLYVPTLRAALAEADVLVDDHTPAEQDALGLDLDAIARRHPDLVIVSVTGHGLSGPDADRPACELTVYHAGGEGATLPSENVYRLHPDRPPVRAGRFLADHDTGLTAAVAVLGGLVGRRRGGGGAFAEVAGTEVECGLNRTTLSRAWFERRDYDRTYRGYDYAGALRCQDGWVAIRPVEERHWVSFCRVIGRPDLATDPRFADRGRRYDNADLLTVELETWTGVRTRDQVRASLLEAGCPGGPFLEPSELADDPAVASRRLLGPVAGGGLAPVRSFVATVRGGQAPGVAVPTPATPRTPPAPRTPPPVAGQVSSNQVSSNQVSLDQVSLGCGGAARGGLPLAGLRVVDLTWVAAGPYTTELLAFLGADVVRVESPRTPDLFRRSMSDARADLDSSIRFMDLNQAKRSVLADLKTADGLDLVLRMVERADVLVENYRPGVRNRLGLGDDVVFEHNPNLVVLALSGFGTAALDADRPGYASVFNAEGGLGAMTGYPDAPPSDIRDTNDLRAGTNGCLGVLAGLLHVLGGGGLGGGGGGGVSVDAAARDALVVLQGHLVLQASRGGRPTRAGNTLDRAVPYDCYRCADGRWVAVGVRTRSEWESLAALLGPAAAEVALAELAVRLVRRDEIDALVGGYAAARTAVEVVDALTAAGVPAGLSASASDVAADPHLRARGALREVDHPRLGTITLMGPPFRWRPAGAGDYTRPPLLGEHTDLVADSWALREPASGEPARAGRR